MPTGIAIDVSRGFKTGSRSENDPLARSQPTWQPTPMNSNFLTSGANASTVASTSRLGDSVGFTPLAAMMSATQRATTGRGLNLHVQEAGWEAWECDSAGDK